jgi:hypothetical protein
MKNKPCSIPIIFMIIFLSSCGPSTHLTSTWTDPSVKASGFKPFNKVLVVAKLKDESGSRIAEDKIAAQFPKGNAVPSYSYLQQSDTVNELVDQKLKKDGFDGLVTMRLTGIDKSLYVEPGGYYGYYGFYGPHYGGYVSEDHTYMVETCIYSLANGKMLWSGTTSTLNPDNVGRAVDDILAAIKSNLTREGLMKPPEQ